MLCFKVVIAIAISLTFCLAVDLNDKCSRTGKLVKCSKITPNDYGLIEDENILIENSVVLMDNKFLQKFPKAIQMQFYRVKLTFDLSSDDESSLRKLSIDNCELSTGISDGLRELEAFTLKNTRNGVEILESLWNLNKLTVFNTSISKISLKNKEHLNWLDLSYNNLKTIPDDIPAGITYLDLSGNSIEKVKKEDFADLSNLEILLLESNKIKNLSSTVFAELQSLRMLFLGNNSLESADFEKPLKLTFLDLSFNKISRVENLSNSTRLILEETIIYKEPKTASHVSLALVIVFCGLVLIFIFYCGK
ncbi:hypothetical protein ACFFRR_000266 [Megaselia abdita]